MSLGVLALVSLVVPALAVGAYVKIVTQQQVDNDSAMPGLQYTFVPLSKYGYNLSVSPTMSVIFDVKTCNDAHVGLMENVGDDSTLYAVVIGGWGNARNGIHYRQQNLDTGLSNKIVAPPLDCDEFKTFQVSWLHGDIVVRTDRQVSSWNTITHVYTIPPSASYQVRDVGFSTALWATGKWTFQFATASTTSSFWTTESQFEGVSMKKGVLWTMNSPSQVTCALLCHGVKHCWSFTFDTEEETCQGHNDIFVSKEDGGGEITLSSSYFVFRE